MGALQVEGRAVPVSNLEKKLYASGFTKAQVIDYYIRVAPSLLPHLKDRPVTLKRYPDGVRGEFFYEKDAPRFTPDWVHTFPVPRRGGGPDIRYILINDLATLVWCANLANLEIHPFLHRVPNIDTPTYLVFDLDPGPGADVLTCAEVALLLREALSTQELECFPKVSGSKGLQVYIPLNTPATYGQTQPFARALAETLARDHPGLIVADMAKALRRKRVFIDWSQNADFKTTIGVYSLRAKRDEPFVSLPVRWEELRTAVRNNDAGSLYFTPGAALARLDELGDLFAPVLSLAQRLPDTPRNLTEYHRKRDFAKTPEPTGGLPRASRQGSRRRFVIQKHAASRLHYDLFVPPMQPKLVAQLPEGDQWQYEIKLDGYRALAVRTSDRVLLYSRRNNTLNNRFPAIAEALSPLPQGTMLDGEIVALDESGRPVFNLLQNWRSSRPPLLYYVFDALAYEGKDLTKLPLRKRRGVLEHSALPGLSDPVRLSAAVAGKPKELIAAAREQGIEGFVAKRLDSVYEAGKRTGAWVKVKVNKGQELVIGGYLPGKHGFDALLVGYHDKGKLKFISKIRNGFTPLLRQQVAERFKGLETGTVPFANLPEPKGARRGMALTAEAMKQCVWLEPKLVAQIEYTDWTKADHLRHARFAGLRDDKDAREVVKEEPTG